MSMTRLSPTSVASSRHLGGEATAGWLLQRKCSCGSSTPSLTGRCEECQSKKRLGAQTNLRLSEPGDLFEREADRISEEVVQPGRDVDGSHRVGKPVARLQREEMEMSVESEEEVPEEEFEGEVEPVEESSLEEEEEAIIADDSGMPKRESGASNAGETSASVRIPKGGGRALEKNVQRFMGQRIGHDFSHVRVHTDGEAANSARRLNAHAYTVGADIYFNEGRYNPHDLQGQKLLAHELTHVVQQSAAGPAPDSPVQRQQAKPAKRRRRAPDSPAGKGRGRRRETKCSGSCAPAKAPKHDGCNSGTAAVGARRITDLHVRRGAHEVIATWSSGSSNTWPCSPSTRSGRGGKTPTPLVKNDKVGVKCDQCHTNRHGDGMGWFTGFASRGRAIGFHNSQLVGPHFESHGCVRVSCSVAKTIHDNSSSGVTTINVTA
jgi:hypothetical protein